MSDVPSVSAHGTTYLNAALAQIPRLLSQLDREPASPTFGCFDRDHWAWKFRDHPLGMLQAASYPLALLRTFPDTPYHGNEALLQWIHGSLAWTIAQQRRNGAFDAFSPNEQNPGPTLGIAHGIAETVRLLGLDELPPPLRERALDSLRRACDFALEREEDHAFVSNHWALFAVAFYDAQELLHESVYGRKAEAVIDRILHEQSADGWYREYDGPDPGYESLGIFHLAVYWKRTGSTRVLESLQHSLDFYAHCIHGDGSVGGVYGSRQTRLYFPGGFEMLASASPTGAAIAAFMRAALGRGNVLTPAACDAENLPPLLYTYLEAAAAAGSDQLALPLPCETLMGQREFAESIITVAGTPHYYAVVNGAKGGVCRVHRRPHGQLAYEDAGYLVRANGRQWSSQALGMGCRKEATDGKEVALTTTLAEARAELLTPAKFLLLRLLNLTAFRSIAVGRRIRRMVVARLITARRPGPFRLERLIRFEPSEIRIQDRLISDANAAVEAVLTPRAFTGLHMGSAKYFHDSDLESLSEPPTADLAASLNQQGWATRDILLRFVEPR